MMSDKGTTFHAHSIALKVQLNSDANEEKVSSCGKDLLWTSTQDTLGNYENVTS